MSNPKTLIISMLILCSSLRIGNAGDLDLGKQATGILASLPTPALAGAWSDFLSLVDARKGDSKAAIAKLKSYFISFGYLKNTSSAADSSFNDALESAVKLYQQNFRLPVTGALDSNTLSQIVKPRCGGEDVGADGVSQMLQNHTHSGSSTSNQFVKHYSFFPGNPRWISKDQLTYAFDESKMLSTIPEESVKDAFRRGFQRWAAIVPLKFSESASISRADIVIEFAGFDHGDSHPFDGKLGILAHAFSPEDGRFHLDASENWSTDLKSDRSLTAVDLESIAVHEIGHLIGLGHSGDSAAIMFPSISPREVRTDFGQDDIDGAQALYGANPNYVPGAPINVGTDSNSQKSSAAAERSPSTLRILGLLVIGFLMKYGFFP